jgi:Phosphatidylserine decarboxylase
VLFNSSTSPQVAFHQAGHEIRRSKFSTRDPNVHRVPRTQRRRVPGPYRILQYVNFPPHPPFTLIIIIPFSTESFNEFFYRKLKPSARLIEKPDDPYRLVSAADCRFMAFTTVDDATRLWIKGREFTVARLLGEAYKDQAERYTGGALAIFRLAPQDYHRFHSPVEGRIGAMTYISGEYYTVNVGVFFWFLVFGWTLMCVFVCSPRRLGRRLMCMARTHARWCQLIVRSLVGLWLCVLVR